MGFPEDGTRAMEERVARGRPRPASPWAGSLTYGVVLLPLLLVLEALLLIGTVLVLPALPAEFGIVWAVHRFGHTSMSTATPHTIVGIVITVYAALGIVGAGFVVLRRVSRIPALLGVIAVGVAGYWVAPMFGLSMLAAASGIPHAPPVSVGGTVVAFVLAGALVVTVQIVRDRMRDYANRRRTSRIATSRR